MSSSSSASTAVAGLLSTKSASDRAAADEPRTGRGTSSTDHGAHLSDDTRGAKTDDSKKPEDYWEKPTPEQVANNSMHSIFALCFKLRHLEPRSKSKYRAAKLKYYNITKKVDPNLPGLVEEEKDKGKGRQQKEDVVDEDEDRPLRRNDGERTATAFAFDQRGDMLRLITCAHSIGEVYGNGYHAITADEVNAIFHITAQCSHEEMRIVDGLDVHGRPINEEMRWHTDAMVIALDTRKDVMVLELPIKSIYCGDDGTDAALCSQPHPPLQLMNGAPERLCECILQAWPAQRVSTLMKSELSFNSRTYPSLTQDNPKDYNMKLLEFTSMAAESGCSGGAVINLENQLCMGMFHGVVGGKRGFAISAAEIINFLNAKENCHKFGSGELLPESVQRPSKKAKVAVPE